MKKFTKIIVLLCVFSCLALGFSINSSADSVTPKTTIKSVEAEFDSITVKWKKVNKDVWYQLQYSTGKNFIKKKTKTVNIKDNKINSKTIENLKAKKKYFLRIRTFKKENGKKYFSSWSSKKSIKTKRLIKLKRIAVTPKEKELNVGQNVQLNTELYPSNTSFNDVRYTSLNENVAKVTYNGWVTAVGSGTTHIRVNVDGTNKHKLVKIVVEIPTTGIKITNPVGINMENGEKFKLNASVYPSNATNKKVIWRTSDKTKATVDSNGLVTALRPTEYVNITAMTQDKKFRSSYTLKINQTSGLITKEKLDSLNLLTTNNLMIVAHPDDETFWGGAHLFNSEYLNKSEPFKSSGKIINSNYFVVVLTNSWDSVRSNDLAKIMNATNNKYLILSYPDVRLDGRGKNGKYYYESDDWTTCKSGLNKDIELLLNYKKWDVIVTHNPDGEYQKSHHKMTSKAVTDIYNSNILNKDTPLFYFGMYYNKNEKIPGKQINETDILIKDKLVSMYSKNVQGAKDGFGQMFHYENWILSTKWEEVRRNKYNYEYFESLENAAEK